MVKVIDLTGRDLKPDLGKWKTELGLKDLIEVRIERVVKDKACSSGYSVDVEVIRKENHKLDLGWFKDGEEVKDILTKDET